MYKRQAPKEVFEKKEFNDPVKKSKKGPLVLLILILIVILLLAIVVGIAALIVWAVIAIIHAIAGSAMLGLLFSKKILDYCCRNDSSR